MLQPLTAADCSAEQRASKGQSDVDSLRHQGNRLKASRSEGRELRNTEWKRKWPEKTDHDRNKVRRALISFISSIIQMD
ncbi:hypothetical protein C0Q70_00379 [Pomacea canaliculata]|uniref:Uncharacterized protein n=1 Tax=Pomacea canaliculata TaxID=400727 RepID=A0A2T7PWL3_POMCA|nr:hypothetical protein C0Q70_00379 [Pomacea canaliculata]